MYNQQNKSPSLNDQQNKLFYFDVSDFVVLANCGKKLK